VTNLPRVSIDALVSLVPPPESPVDATADWPKIEAALGVHLPGDYRELVTRYGTGEFCDLVHPLTANELVTDGLDALEVERELATEGPYPLHPDPGGLLPWGRTSNGHLLCWRTDDWTVVVYAPRDMEYTPYETTATGFLHGWLSGALTPFPASFTETAQWFDQPRELTHVSVRLAKTDRPHEEQLRLLQAALAPVKPLRRNDYQNIFEATDERWRVLFEDHGIRIAFPPEQHQEAMEKVRTAAATMGREILGTQKF
jgi:hypothetical protein